MSKKIVTLFLCIKHTNFRSHKIFETQKGSPANFFCTLRQKILTENRATPPPPFVKNIEISERIGVC